MTASETGREIPADELVERLRRRLDKWRHTGPDRKPWLNAPLAEIRAMDEMLARSEARIASLEAERARTVELPTWKSMDTAPLNGKHCILAVEHGCFIYSVQGAFDGRQWRHVLDTDAQPLAWMPNILLPSELRPKRFRSGRALASEKGGQADG